MSLGVDDGALLDSEVLVPEELVGVLAGAGTQIDSPSALIDTGPSQDGLSEDDELLVTAGEVGDEADELVSLFIDEELPSVPEGELDDDDNPDVADGLVTESE